MKTRNNMEAAVSAAFNKRLGRLRVVHELLEQWCGQRLNNREDPLKSALLLGAYIDACHHFAESHFEEREALFNLHAFRENEIPIQELTQGGGNSLQC